MANQQHTKLPYPMPFQEVDFKTYDYLIGGKLVVGKAVMTDSYVQMINDLDHEARMQLKYKLANEMATYMVENNLVEFTQMDDPLTFNKTVMARAYLAPSEQVKILRLANKIV
jgi:hypothetical protein